MVDRRHVWVVAEFLGFLKGKPMFVHPVVMREQVGAKGMHIPYIFAIKWGAIRSYLEFSNHLVVVHVYIRTEDEK